MEKKKEERKIKTNVGTIPIEDYRKIVAVQNGFENYEEMKKEGYSLYED